MKNEKSLPKYHYSPDVKERESMDNGFSKGWGFHFPSNESYWLDCHTHYGRKFTPAAYLETYRMLEEWFSRMDAFRLGGIIAIITDPEMFPVCREVSSHNPYFNWIYWMPYDKPDPELMQKAMEYGARGLKLHNNIILSGAAKPDIWLNKEWAKVFHIVEKAELPVLWHMTQRMSASPYHGGNVSKPFPNSNQEVLSKTLEVVRRYPGIPFIGAHQIYLGLEKLEELFKKYRNLYIDSSIGFFLRWADTLSNSDRNILRNFFIKHSDRILFGTDSGFTGKIDEYLVQSFLCHPRFILHLNLPDAELQNTAHANAERLFRIEPLSPVRRGNSRP
ncbi:MAG TPA: amidohydrolase family protein [bacterium]|nr:amidohydrolase family protein [bacterium]